MATKGAAATGGAKGSAKGGAKGGKGAAAKPGTKAAKKGAASAGRAAVDFTKRDHAGAGLPVAAPRLKTHYEQTVRGVLAAKFGFSNPHQVPTLTKIVVNCGVGDAVKQPKLLDVVVEELALITGQKPVRRKAKKSIANFGLREGQEIGASVTLRGARMWEFFDRFVTIACPRIRDFRGIGTRAFDGRGNFTLGIKEQLIFPEINYDMVEQVHGFDITFVTSAEKDEVALALLHQLGMPFRGDDKPVTPRVAQPQAA